MGTCPDWYEYRLICQWLQTDPIQFYNAPMSGFWYFRGVEGLNAEATAADLRRQWNPHRRPA